uniref:Uncharacterized protein n=1 Tax=Trichuris muris TaxID=70415 RepID=A0A5S6Q454_TRIMR
MARFAGTAQPCLGIATPSQSRPPLAADCSPLLVSRFIGSLFTLPQKLEALPVDRRMPPPPQQRLCGRPAGFVHRCRPTSLPNNHVRSFCDIRLALRGNQRRSATGFLALAAIFGRRLVYCIGVQVSHSGLILYGLRAPARCCFRELTWLPRALRCRPNSPLPSRAVPFRQRKLFSGFVTLPLQFGAVARPFDLQTAEPGPNRIVPKRSKGRYDANAAGTLPPFGAVRKTPPLNPVHLEESSSSEEGCRSSSHRTAAVGGGVDLDSPVPSTQQAAAVAAATGDPRPVVVSVSSSSSSSLSSSSSIASGSLSTPVVVSTSISRPSSPPPVKRPRMQDQLHVDVLVSSNPPSAVVSPSTTTTTTTTSSTVCHNLSQHNMTVPSTGTVASRLKKMVHACNGTSPRCENGYTSCNADGLNIQRRPTIKYEREDSELLRIIAQYLKSMGLT